MDIIYSRKRIKINKINKRRKLKLYIVALVLIIFIGIGIYIRAAYPIFISSCKNRASSMAVNIVNEEVARIAEYYTYEDIVEVQKDDKGSISTIQARFTQINNIVSLITENIQERIDESDTEIIYINLGKVTGISALSYIGPTFEIEMERAGDINTKVTSEFVSVGINQTLHRINLELDCKMSILTPLESIAERFETKVILAETVIVGEVPNTFLNSEDIIK